MRFLMLVKHPENAASSGAPPKEFMDQMAKMAEGAAKSGNLLQSGGLVSHCAEHAHPAFSRASRHARWAIHRSQGNRGRLRGV